MAKKLELNERNGFIASMGGYGFQYLVTAGAHTPPDGYVFSTLIPDTDAEFSADSITGADLPQSVRSEGRIIPGVFSSVTMVSGVVLAYLVPESLVGGS